MNGLDSSILVYPMDPRTAEHEEVMGGVMVLGEGVERLRHARPPNLPASYGLQNPVSGPVQGARKARFVCRVVSARPTRPQMVIRRN